MLSVPVTVDWVGESSRTELLTSPVMVGASLVPVMVTAMVSDEVPSVD